MKKNLSIRKIISILFFAEGIVLCIVAFCGHKPAFAASACYFFAVTAGMSAMNKDKK